MQTGKWYTDFPPKILHLKAIPYNFIYIHFPKKKSYLILGPTAYVPNFINILTLWKYCYGAHCFLWTCLSTLAGQYYISRTNVPSFVLTE